MTLDKIEDQIRLLKVLEQKYRKLRVHKEIMKKRKTMKEQKEVMKIVFPKLSFKEARVSNEGLTNDQKGLIVSKLKQIIVKYDENPVFYEFLPHLEPDSE